MERSEKLFSSRTNFSPFLQLNCSRWKQRESLRVTKIVKEIKFEGVWGELESGKWFHEAIAHKIFETNSSFHVE